MKKDSDHAGAGLLRRLGGQDENAGADHRADAQQGELERAQRAVQRLFLGRRQDGVQRLDAIKQHGRSPV